MKHVSYTIPGVVDENGDPIVFGGFVIPGHALPAQTMIVPGAPEATPASAEIVVEHETEKIPDILPGGGLE